MSSFLYCHSNSFPNALLESGFCAFTIDIELNRPRSIRSVGIADAIVVERGTQSVLYLADTDDDGIPDQKTTIVTADDLNHGVALHGGFLYASSANEVYRWPYVDEASLAAGTVGPMETVITNINVDSQGRVFRGHFSRTLAFDAQGLLYVSVGSVGNVDADSFRSRIRRFSLTDSALFPIQYTDGEVFADGLRNEVGLAFDRHGILWGVDNGPDNLIRADLGGDIHNDNPGEELNRFTEEDIGKHWGYPYCFSEFLFDGGEGAGSVWAWPSYLNQPAPAFFSGPTITDQTCRESTLRSNLAMQAHSAPLGITFYEWKPRTERPPECSSSEAFPRTYDGYAFIAFHGSWNRDIPTGYKVVYVPMDSEGHVMGTAQDIFAHTPPNAQWPDGLRPVDVAFDACGRLLVTSDGTRGNGAKVFRIQRRPPFCFSGASTVDVEGKGIVQIQDVQVGDRVLTSGSQYETVYSFGHYNTEDGGEYLQIHTDDTKRPLELSDNHMVFVEGGRCIPASLLKRGDRVVLGSGDTALIRRINSVKRQGMYAPFTLSGTIVVDGVLASSFVAFQDSETLLLLDNSIVTPVSHQWLAHTAETPRRLLHRLGLWIGHEDRSPSGIARRLEWPLQATHWLLDQKPSVQVAVLGPLVVVLAGFWLVETAIVNLGIVAMLLLLIGSFRGMRTTQMVQKVKK